MKEKNAQLRRSLLYLFFLESGGRYAYVAVAGNEMGSFRRACNTPGVDIAQHCEVLAQGAGQPDEATRRKMQEYGFRR